jgi:hypothetical protein
MPPPEVGTSADLSGRPARWRRWLVFPNRRPLNSRQVRKRMEAALDEIAALGGAYQLTAGQIRRRLLLLERQLREVLERWPPD